MNPGMWMKEAQDLKLEIENDLVSLRKDMQKYDGAEMREQFIHFIKTAQKRLNDLDVTIAYVTMRSKGNY